MEASVSITKQLSSIIEERNLIAFICNKFNLKSSFSVVLQVPITSFHLADRYDQFHISKADTSHDGPCRSLTIHPVFLFFKISKFTAL